MRRHIRFALLASVLAISSVTAFAEEPRAGAASFRWNEAYSLLVTTRVQDELGITAEQRTLLNTYRSERAALVDRVFELDSMPEDARPEAYRLIQEEMRVLDERVSSLLLPHQAKRAKQILTQRRIRVGEDAGGVLHRDIVQELGLTPNQRTDLTRVVKEAREEMKREIELSQKRAREKVLGTLTEEQRARYQEIVGEPFDFTDLR